MSSRATWVTAQEREEIARMYDTGMSTRAIARLMGRNYKTVRLILLRLADEARITVTRTCQLWEEGEVTELHYYYTRGCTVGQIAAYMELPYWRVNSKIQKMQRGKGWKRSQ